MKKFLQTTQIALLISTVVFAQKSGPGKQEAPSQTSVIVMGAHSNSIILLSPADGKLIGTGDASKPVLFRWTAVNPKPKEAVTYRFKIWQLIQGQSDAEAMRNNQPIITKDVVNITQAAISNLYTGPCKPPYLCDFVWAVGAFNNGNSQHYSFKFSQDNLESHVAKSDNCKFIGHPEIIVFDLDCNIVASVEPNSMPNRISMNVKSSVLLDDAKVGELAIKRTDNLKTTKEAFAKDLKNVLSSGKQNAKMNMPGWCWVEVFCNNPNHAAGCGWLELRPCGGWNIDRPR